MGVDRTATLLQPRLNYDTLLHILSFLEERRDISSFMKTCKTLCHHATLRLLDHHRGAVRIKNVPQAISFCMFMVPNLGNLDRLRYLCNLHVDLCFESHFKVLAVLLCLVIQYSKNLQTLRIEDSEALLEVGGKEAFDLLRNFKSHHSLTSLTLLEIGDTGRELLEKLEAVSVTDLILSQSASSDDTDSPLHQSLQSTITYMDLLSAPDLIYATNLRCPQLTHLNLIADEPIITDLLVLAFPKLRFLEVRMNLVEDEFADMAHESNRVALARLDKTWDNLLLLSGQAIDLYTLALSCDVEMLDVHSISPADVPFVIHLLEHNSTAIVKLRINLKKFTIPVFEEFIRMACEVLDTCCSDLTLRFVLTGSTIVLQDLILTLLPFLHQSPVKLLTIKFCFQSATPRTKLALKDNRDPHENGTDQKEQIFEEPESIDIDLKALSLESLALRIVQGNPCTYLKVVTLKIVCTDYSQRYKYEVSQNKEGENGKDDMEQEVGSVVD